MLPATKLMIDNAIVALHNFVILLAYIIPIIPTGMSTHKIMALPQIPMVSSNLNKELEFRMFVGVEDHHISKGIIKNSMSSNKK